ncbi:MAG: DUF1934 family protein [Anaeroplasma sp.]
MQVTFHSLDSDENKIFFKSDAHYENDYIVFEDKSCQNTIIYLKIDSIINLIRKGKVNTNISFIEGIKTDCHYNNDIGLEFDFQVLTNNININKNKITIEYTMFLDGKEFSTHKIWILLQ